MNNRIPPRNRGIILSLAFTQALNSACVPISVIVASLTVVELAAGNGRWAGVPSSVGMMGGALASFVAGRVLPTVGYRKVLFFAALSGMAGSALAAFSSVQELLIPFLAAFILIGMAIGLIGLSRYAAAESSEPSARARSMGRVVLGSTAGAILGPLLVAPSGGLAEEMGLPNLVGPWLAAFLCYGASLANTFLFLRPEPKVLARLRTAAADRPTVSVAAGAPAVEPAGAPAAEPAPSLWSLLGRRRILLPVGSMVAAQVAMVLVMAITPLHMHSHHHGMGTISRVITAHFIGMYGFSILSGWLADRLGRMPTVGLGGLVLASSCLLAPLSHDHLSLMAALFLLGLGWSFCFLGGSTALSEGLAENERGRVQGLTEALVSLSSGTASLSSGVLFASFGFPAMTLIGLAASGLPLLLFILHLAGRPPAPKVQVVRAENGSGP